jgi:hypothetical protein
MIKLLINKIIYFFTKVEYFISSFNEKNLEVMYLHITKKEAYIQISFVFDIVDCLKISTYIVYILTKVLNEYKDFFREEKEKFGNKYVIQVTTILYFRSKDGWSGTVQNLSTGNLESINDIRSIIEFGDETLQKLLEVIEYYNIDKIEEMVIKII